MALLAPRRREELVSGDEVSRRSPRVRWGKVGRELRALVTGLLKRDRRPGEDCGDEEGFEVFCRLHFVDRFYELILKSAPKISRS